jgi:hypothetical protein
MSLLIRVTSLPSSLTEWLTFGGVFVALGIAWIVYSIIDEQKLKVYRAYCHTRGFRLRTTARTLEEEHHAAAWPLVALNLDGTWEVTISGTYNRVPFEAFEYQWQAQTLLARTTSTRRICGIIWTLDSELPHFVLTHEGLWKWLAMPVGPARITFDLSERFARTCWLQGNDHAAVRALFTPDVRRFFATHPDQHIAAAERELMWWRKGRLPRPGALDALLASGDAARALFGRE